MPVYTQNLNPTGSLTLSALLAAIPLVLLLALLGIAKLRAHWAALASLAAAIVLAIAVNGMPVFTSVDAAVFGAAISLYSVLWITFNAIWIYNMTVRSGHFAVLRRGFESVSPDIRVQVVVIAFAFGALLEALAGGGSPVAICAVMLIALGMSPLKAAACALIADTAPVAFGGLGNPITNLALPTVTNLHPDVLGAMAGRQTPFIAFLVPFVLLYVADGVRGLKQAWPVALVGGGVFAVVQFWFANYYSYKLTDIFAAIITAGAVVLMMRVWKPSEIVSPLGSATPVLPAEDMPPAVKPQVAGPGALGAGPVPVSDSLRQRLEAFAPYAIIVAVFSLAQIDAIKQAIDPTVKGSKTSLLLMLNGQLTNGALHGPAWPGLHIVNTAGKVAPQYYGFSWLAATGTLLFISGLITIAVLRITPVDAARTYGATLQQFSWAIVTILAVFGLAYVMNLSGMTVTLGKWLAGSGGAFPLIAPIVGWFGVTLTGTDVGSNVLFGKLQITAAQQIGVSKSLLAAANSTGGVLGKMISPQNLAIGCAATKLVGQEGNLFRSVFGWSLLLLAILCAIVFLQSTPVLGWMVVN